MTPQLRFLEDRNAVARDLEAPAARRLEGDGRLWKYLPEFGRQTGGPRFVASNRAVLDLDVHMYQDNQEPPGIPARFISFRMTVSCFAMANLSESTCSWSSAMSCR